MRKLAFLLVLLLAASFAQAQYKHMVVISDTATTTWEKIERTQYRNFFYVEITNDATSGSNVIYFALEDDTTSTNRFPLKWGEVLTLPNLNVSHVYVKADSATILYRLRYMY